MEKNYTAIENFRGIREYKVKFNPHTNNFSFTLNGKTLDFIFLYYDKNIKKELWEDTTYGGSMYITWTNDTDRDEIYTRNEKTRRKFNEHAPHL